jgi:hypothetical protein
MGDRISIQFSNGERKSVALFAHSSGMGLVTEAKDYVRALRESSRLNNSFYPLDRMEPETVMVDFIRHLTSGMDRVFSNLYLGADENDGDNSDNGNHVISLVEQTSLDSGERIVEFFYLSSRRESPKLRRLSVKEEDENYISGIDLDRNAYRCFLKDKIQSGKVFEVCK